MPNPIAFTGSTSVAEVAKLIHEETGLIPDSFTVSVPAGTAIVAGHEKAGTVSLAVLDLLAAIWSAGAVRESIIDKALALSLARQAGEEIDPALAATVKAWQSAKLEKVRAQTKPIQVGPALRAPRGAKWLVT